MIKRIAIVIGITICAAIVATACKSKGKNKTKKEDQDPHATKLPPYEHTVTGSDVFETGYYSDKIGRHSQVKIIHANPDSQVTWKVYFTEEELPEEEIGNLLLREPDITGSGECSTTKHPWIYIFCDVNAKTATEPTDDSVTIWYQPVSR